MTKARIQNQASTLFDSAGNAPALLSSFKKPDGKMRIAFFDIDGTIFRSSLLIELINGLVEQGIFPKKAGNEIIGKQIAWLDRTGRYDEYLYQVVLVHLKYIKGCRWEDVKRVVEIVIKEQGDRVYRYTRDLIKKLKSEGYFMVTISGSPVYMVQEFGKHMGFNSAFGQILEIKDGVFTGEIVNKDFRNKEGIINGFLANCGFEADMANSIAVGDTDNDIPMLKMVGHPIAFNPNRELAQYAKKEGWDIIVERKDSIYRIKDFELLGFEGMDEAKREF